MKERTKKYLRVTMPDSSVWDVPAEIVAKDRASYYKEKDPTSYGTPERTYTAEFDITMDDEYELIDWARNNMDWDDVKEFAVEDTEPDEPDFQEGWLNGEHEIIEY